MNAALPGHQIAEVTASQLYDDESDEVMQVLNTHPVLLEKTPLWLYVLKEAEVLGDGKLLGPYAGRIVMEALHAAIEASDISILDGTNGKPTPPQANGDKITIPDLMELSSYPDHLGTDWPQ